MATDVQPESVSAAESRRRTRASIGLVAVVVIALLGLGFVAWGVTSSKPAEVATIAKADEQWGKVTSGELVEETTVEGTVSRGEVFSVDVAQAPTTTTTTTSTTTTTPVTTAAVATAAGAAAVTDTATTSPAAATAVTGTTLPAAAAAGGAIGVAPGGGSGSSTRIVTGMAPVGTVLHSGEVVFTVDGRSTVLLKGTVPAWRAINADTTRGVDVLQLETALAAAGFDADGNLDVDDTVDENTIQAIQDWQTSLDMDPDGEIGLGEVIFEPGDVTVVALNSSVGSVVSPGASIVDLRRGQPYVDVSTDATWAKVGQSVKVSADQNQLTGKVVSLESGIARVELAGASQLKDGATARVTLSRAKVAKALLVPASAVQVSDVDGPTVVTRVGGKLSVVRVSVLASANSKAAVKVVKGTLTDGTEVRMY